MELQRLDMIEHTHTHTHTHTPDEKWDIVQEDKTNFSKLYKN